MLFPNATIVFFIISFLIFMMLLNEVFVKPVGEVIERRNRKIAAGLEASKESRDKIRDLTADYEKTLAQSRDAAQSEINSAVSAAQAVRTKELSGVKERSRKRLDESRKELQAEKTVLLENLVTEEAQLVQQIVGKVLGDSKKVVDINSQSVQRALEEAI
jgi:F-type H+-transporting ATPase subunit b